MLSASRTGRSGRETVEEIVGLAFERWGDDAPSRMAGSCSFVVRDDRRDRFLAIADRVGLSRLYYVERSNGALVSTAVESLLPLVDGLPALDLASIAGHVCRQPLPFGSTFFERIRAVPPGHALVIGRDGLSVSSYWRLGEAGEFERPDDDSCVDALREVLERVTSEQLGNDRLALALSGGVDSPVAALIVRSLRNDGTIPAIRIVAPELGDTARSAEIAAALDLESHEIDVTEDYSPFDDGDLPTRRGTPYLPMVARIQKRMIAEAASLGTDTLVTGWGGDELFGGNVSSYPELLLAGRWTELVRQMRSHARARARPPSSILYGYLLRPLLAPFAAPILDRVRPRVQPVSWLGEALRPMLRTRSAARTLSPVPGRSTRLLRARYPGSVQAIEPVVEAARKAGIEVTSPFADHRVNEFALGLPTSQIFRGGDTKIVLRNLLRRRLPARLVDDLGKALLGERFAGLFRGAEALAVRDLMTSMRSADLGFVDEQALQLHYEGFASGRHRDLTFWNTLTLEAWLRRYF